VRQLAHEILRNRDAIVQCNSVPWLSEEHAEGLRCLLSADGVIDCGGASLSGHWKAYFYEKCFDYILAPRPLVITGQGIDRFELPGDRHLLTSALSDATEITLREPISERYLRTLGCQAPIRTTGDDTLTLDASPPARCKRLLNRAGVDPERPFLAFQYRHYLDYQEDHYNDLFATLVDEAIRVSGLPVVGVPMHFAATDEREHLTEISRRLANSDRFHIVRNHLTPAEAKGIFAAAATAFGISYHSAVFSLSSGTPYLGLYRGPHYKQKMQGLSELYGLPELAIPLEGASPKPFGELLLKQLRERDSLRDHLLNQNETLVREVHDSRRRFVEQIRPTLEVPSFAIAQRSWRWLQFRERLRYRTQQLRVCERTLKAQEVQLKELKRTLRNERQAAEELRKHNQKLDQQLQSIRGSSIWRLLENVAHIKSRVLGR